MTEVELRAMSKEAALMARRMERWDRARRHDLELARAVQRFLLPPEQHAGSTYLLCHGYRPRADRGADFADVHVAPDGGAALLLADLCGEGPSAALFAVVLKSAFARAAQRELEPASILMALNDELGVMAHSNDQITALVAIFDPAARTLTMAAAEHPAPLILRGPDARQIELQSGPPLMVERDAKYRPQKVDLSLSDRMIFYTDGAVEVAVEGGGLLGPAGLSRLVEESADHHGKGFVEALLAALADAAGHDHDDDVALLVLECMAGAAVPDRDGLAATTAPRIAEQVLAS
jgi:sigma-B regulation protein RsbU (phosphoserine phosphatase)